MKNSRTILKTLSWRAFSVIVTILIFGIITRDIQNGLSFGVVDTIIKTVSYFVHEKVWG